MKIWRIKNRILLSALLPALSIALLLYLFFVNAQHSFFDELSVNRGITITEQFASAVEYGVITANTGLLDELGRTLLNDQDIVGVSIVDIDGNILLRRGYIDVGKTINRNALTVATLCLEDIEHLVFCAPIYATQLETDDFASADSNNSAKTAVGYVAIALSTIPVNQRRDQAILRSLGITLLILLITAFIVIRIAAQIAKPIESLTRSVYQVGSGHLDEQIIAESNSEIGQLQEGINLMINSLKHNQDELQGRVDRATAQLQNALDELERKNSDLLQQRKQADAANQSKSHFLANMSHEIRTPLNGILGLQLLLEDTPLNQQQQNYLYHLDLATKSLRALIEDILDFSRIEAGKLTLNLQPFNPVDVIEDAVLMLAPQAHEKNLQLVVDTAADFPRRLNGDPNRLRQVLINLIANAIKFTPQGEVIVNCLYLDRAAEDAHGHIRLEVHDTGIGIPRDKLPGIFDSFSQVDDDHTRPQGGTGLGTAIARELILLMGGQIDVHSEEGKGSCFWFEIPAVAAAQDDSQIRPADTAAHNLLVLEHHQAHAQAMRHCGESLGITITVLTTASELDGALQKAIDAGQPIDAVFLAETTRKSSQTGLDRHLRETFAAQCPPLVHLTLTSGDTEPALFDYQLNKPVTSRGLHKALCRFTGDDEKACSLSSLLGSSAQPSIRILVAEDNTINALVISSFLEKQGHEVVVVNNGHQALAAMEGENIDLVFMDMRMPEMDGLTTTRQWRDREGRASHMPIVALTANATTQDRSACLEAGMDDFLAKPIEPEQLAAILSRYYGDGWEKHRRAGGV